MCHLMLGWWEPLHWSSELLESQSHKNHTSLQQHQECFLNCLEVAAPLKQATDEQTTNKSWTNFAVNQVSNQCQDPRLYLYSPLSPSYPAPSMSWQLGFLWTSWRLQ
jgi:hypothetical protein